MSLAERLREIATWLDGEAYTYDSERSVCDEYETKANELRILAAYVDGRVVVPVEYQVSQSGNSVHGWTWESKQGEKAKNLAEVTFILQARADKRDGRTLP